LPSGSGSKTDYNEIVPRKPKPIPLPETADPKRRFDNTLTALLSVNKAELHAIEEQIKGVQKEKARRRKRTGTG
jgi:hypothetical protein